MRLIVVRHGETEDNVSDIVQGQRHGKLTKRGISQAKKAALFLKGEKIDAIFSSDLRRAKHTALEIKKFHDAPIYYSKELRERNGGVFEGKYHHELFADQKSSGISKIKYKPKGGESLIDLRRRVASFAGAINRKYKGKSVLIVTHGLVIKCLASLYLGMPLKDAAALGTNNAGILVIEKRAGKGRLILDKMFRRSGIIR